MTTTGPEFIFMLNTELGKSNCNSYHALGDDDLLIVQKAVQSSTTDEDTGFNFLLSYHCSLESHGLIWVTEKTQKGFSSGTSKPQRKSLVKTSATTSMLSLGVTQHHNFMGMERRWPLASTQYVLWIDKDVPFWFSLHTWCDKCRRESFSTIRHWNINWCTRFLLQKHLM